MPLPDAMGCRHHPGQAKADFLSANFESSSRPLAHHSHLLGQPQRPQRAFAGTGAFAIGQMRQGRVIDAEFAGGCAQAAVLIDRLDGAPLEGWHGSTHWIDN